MTLVKTKRLVALLVGALVAAALAMLCLRMCAADSGSGDAGVRTDEPTGAQSSASTGDEAASDAAGKEPGGEEILAEEGLNDYTTAREAALWYVDDAGAVHTFAETPLGMQTELTLNRGAGVRAHASDAALEREGTRYCQLAASYLADLWADLEQYQGGTTDATAFSSELARMVDSDQYVAFLAELTACDTEARSRVRCLAVEADAFETEDEDEPGAATGEAEPEPDFDLDPEEAVELYGGKPSAGAMG